MNWESAVGMCFSVSTDAFTNLCEGRGQAQPCNPVLIISALPANLRDSGAKMADCVLVLEDRLESTQTTFLHFVFCSAVLRPGGVVVAGV